MLILDTDHLVEYQKGTSAQSQRLKERLAQQAQPFGTTIISAEEIMRAVCRDRPLGAEPQRRCLRDRLLMCPFVVHLLLRFLTRRAAWAAAGRRCSSA